VVGLEWYPCCRLKPVIASVSLEAYIYILGIGWDYNRTALYIRCRAPYYLWILSEIFSVKMNVRVCNKVRIKIISFQFE